MACVMRAAWNGAVLSMVAVSWPMPMLIALAKATDTTDVLALARQLCEQGRTAIRVASDLLRADPGP